MKCVNKSKLLQVYSKTPIPQNWRGHNCSTEVQKSGEIYSLQWIYKSNFIPSNNYILIDSYTISNHM